MPVDKQVLLRYKVLNDCFRNPYREYTIEDLVDACSKAMRDELDMMAGVSKRTVQNDIANLETNYHIRLDEKLRRGRQRLYRYVDTSYTLPMYRMNDRERHKLQDAIRVLDHFKGEPLYDWARSFLMQIEAGLFDDDSSTYVSFQSNPDYTGLPHFNNLLQAIIQKRVLKLTYKPFGKDPISATIYPYYLKQFNSRWFLIAQEKGYQRFAHYALDRIEDFKEIAVPYKEADVDFNEYFDDVIGVTVPPEDAEDIVMKVSAKRFNYIRTKPLHLSQRILEDTPSYAIITINVKVNKELESLILSFGPDMEIISPKPLRDKILAKIQAMSEKYTNNAENLHI